MRARPSLRTLLAACAWLCVASSPTWAKPVALQAVEGAPTTSATATPAASDADNDEPSVGEPQFNTTPSPLPPNVDSLGFEATATSEFGALVRLAGPTHFISSVTVVMSSHAIRSDYPAASPFGYSHPLTLKLYAVDRRSGLPAPGAVLASVTQTFMIPWRPEPIAGVTSPLRPWGNNYTGLAFAVSFELGTLTTSLPNEVIAAVSFNTQHAGAVPTGVPGPYNALHLGLASVTAQPEANPETGIVFWKTASATQYSDGGATGANILRRDTGWPYQPALRFNDSPFGLISSAAAILRNVPSEDIATITTFVDASDAAASAVDRSLWQGNDRVRPLWGRLVFDLLAEAADQIAPFANHDSPAGASARSALESMLAAAQALADTALGDAVIVGGSSQRLVRAQDAFDAASGHASTGNAERTISQLADAWREAEMSVR